MDKIIKPGIILCIICICASAILGFAYNTTLEPIAIQTQKTKDKAMKEVLPDADTFTVLESVSDEFMVTEVYEAKKGDEVVGYAIFGYTMEGYSGEIDMLTGVDIEGNVTGISIITASETPGLGDNAKKPEFKQKFVGKTGTLEVVKNTSSPADNEIVAMTSATITSRAVTGAVNNALAFYQESLAEVK